MKDREQLLDILALIIRMVTGAVFIAAAWHKVLDPGAFAQSVYYYHMLPAPLLHLFALYLPWLELVTGLAILLGWGRRGAALLIALMLLMFIAGLAVAMARNLDISCGCFGTDDGHVVGLDLLLRDVLMTAALAFYLWIQRRGDRLDRVQGP